MSGNALLPSLRKPCFKKVSTELNGVLHHLHSGISSLVHATNSSQTSNGFMGHTLSSTALNLFFKLKALFNLVQSFLS